MTEADYSPGGGMTRAQADVRYAPLIAPAFASKTFVSGVSQQVDATATRFVVVSVTFNPTVSLPSTCAVALSPDNSAFTTLVTKAFPALSSLAGTVDGVSVSVPAGWWLRLTVAQATIGAGQVY